MSAESLAQIASDFLTSPEGSAPSLLSDGAFVDQLFTRALGQAADPAGLACWRGELADGASRGAVAAGFAGTPEAVSRSATLLASGLFIADG